MIEFMLSTIAGNRRVNKQQLMDATGKTRPTIKALWDDKAKTIDFETLDKLCAFLHCEPADLIRYVPDESESDKKA